MCTKEEVRQELEKNNVKRDKNLDKKLFKLKEEIIIHIQKVVNEIPGHKTAPETKEAIHSFKENCIRQTTNFNNIMEEMAKDILEIKSILKEQKQNYVSKEEFRPIKQAVKRITDIGLGILIGCGIVVVFYILAKVGLPTP